MGCDGFIRDLNKKVEVSLTCYKCGHPIALGNDAKDHEYCSDDGKKLPVTIEWDNLEEW